MKLATQISPTTYYSSRTRLIAEMEWTLRKKCKRGVGGFVGIGFRRSLEK
jgi:hypothetical protein